MNTTWFLSIPALMFPDQEILVSENTRLTYGQLQDRVVCLANAFRSLGLGRGSRVAILQTNPNWCVEAYYATSKIGGTFVPLSCRAGADQLRYMISTAQPDVLLVGEKHVDCVRSLQAGLPSVKHWITTEERREGMLFLEELRLGASRDDTEEDPDADETNALLYTSGTTGLPKAVMLSYGSFVEYVSGTVEPADGARWGATLLCAPLYHIAGLISIMTSVYSGRRLVLMREFDAREWLRLVEREQITSAFLTPAMLKRLLDEPGLAKADLSSLETLSYGAAPMPLTVIRRAIETLPKKVGFINAFGQTETTATVTMLLPEDHRLAGTPEEVGKRLKRLGSIGRPLPDVELKIVGEDAREVPRGDIGEIVLRTPRMMTGYVGQGSLTQETLVDGWMRTRDLGWVDEDGYVFLAGRKDDIVLRGGEDLAPTQASTILLYPRVSDRMEQEDQASSLATARDLVDTAFAGIRVSDILWFLGSVYENLQMEKLKSNYLAAIPKVVSAAAYGFSLEPIQGGCLAPPESGAGEDGWLDADREAWRGSNPMLRQFAMFSEPLLDRALPAAAVEGRTLQTLMEEHRLTHFVRAPITSVNGPMLGTLSFARTPLQPAFDYNDLRVIHVIAHHMSVVVGHATRYSEIRERYVLAEAALQVIGSSVILTDSEDRVRFANLQAQKLLGETKSVMELPSEVRNGLKQSLRELDASAKRVVTREVPLPWRTAAGDGSLILRSVRIPPMRGTVATFLYSLDQAPCFRHLTPVLSKREIEVLELLARGLQNREIAEALVVTTNTVKHHLKQMFQKLEVKTRSELIVRAFSAENNM